MKCGVDICSVKRIEEAVDRLGENFLKKVFTEEERAYCEKKKSGKFESYAARFAGKEAVYKAISPSRKQEGVFTEVEILNDAEGRPYVQLHGNLKEVAEDKHFEISLSHEKEFAIAMVVTD